MSNAIVFIGDSLTEYFDWQCRFPAYQVMNLGIAGERVEELLGRLDLAARQMGNADTIFVMTGINNIASGDLSILKPYESIISLLIRHFPGSRIVVQSVLPLAFYPEMNKQIQTINAQLKETVEKHHAVYLDVFNSFVDAQGNPKKGLHLDDGVHLSNKGYEMWADVIGGFLAR